MLFPEYSSIAFVEYLIAKEAVAMQSVHFWGEMDSDQIIELIGKGIEVAGVTVIIVGALVATILFIVHLSQHQHRSSAYQLYRHNLGRAILLGLEFLIAGDIIRTVAVSPTFRSLGVTAGIVLIRTFLSMALQLEIEGRWPWQRGQGERQV